MNLATGAWRAVQITVVRHQLAGCLPLILTNRYISQPPYTVVQVAIKTAQLGVFYYTDAVPLEALFLESGRIEAGVFVSSWKSIPDANEATKQLPLGIGSVEELQVHSCCCCSRCGVPVAILSCKVCLPALAMSLMCIMTRESITLLKAMHPCAATVWEIQRSAQQGRVQSVRDAHPYGLASMRMSCPRFAGEAPGGERVPDGAEARARRQRAGAVPHSGGANEPRANSVAA